MKAAKIEFTFLNDEIKTNKDLKGVKILEWNYTLMQMAQFWED
jgi:hypothetical protein